MRHVARAARALVVMGLLAIDVAACAPIPKPRILDEVDEVAQSPAALDAKEYAKPTWARAEKLRLEAWEAQKEGPQARVQFLAEQALATYREAAARARAAKAALRKAKADAEAAALQDDLAAADAELAIALRELDALELRLRVARDAQAPGVSGAPDSPEREAARREAAKGLLAQGQMLCASARLLGVGNGSVKPAADRPTDVPEDPTAPDVLARDILKAEAQLTELDNSLAKVDKNVPIDLASRARASCLSVLSRARRAASPNGAVGSADALLQELSAMSSATSKQAPLDPERDERGVVVTLRNAFDGDTPSSSVRARIEELDRVAAAHASFPVAIVVHTDKPLKESEKSAFKQRGDAIAALFKSVPSQKKVVVVAGDALPVTVTKAERSRNARVEIVFIAPEAL